MTVRELIDRLLDHNPNSEIVILDGFNGGGAKREINYGPVHKHITKQDQDESVDSEKFEINDSVVVIGYGCY